MYPRVDWKGSQRAAIGDTPSGGERGLAEGADGRQDPADAIDSDVSPPVMIVLFSAGGLVEYESRRIRTRWGSETGRGLWSFMARSEESPAPGDAPS